MSFSLFLSIDVHHAQRNSSTFCFFIASGKNEETLDGCSKFDIRGSRLEIAGVLVEIGRDARGERVVFFIHPLFTLFSTYQGIMTD